jgi:hypothetical protein
MDSAILKTFGEIAGIGGLSLGVVLLLFRDIIGKKIFPELPPASAYRLLRLMVVFVFVIGIAGIAAWVVTTVSGSPKSYANVTNIGTIHNEFLTVTGQPLNDQNIEKLIQAAVERTANGDSKGSIPLYEEAIKKAPLPALYNNLAVAYAQQNALPQARDALRSALSKNDSYAPALQNLKELDSSADGGTPAGTPAGSTGSPTGSAAGNATPTGEKPGLLGPAQPFPRGGDDFDHATPISPGRYLWNEHLNSYVFRYYKIKAQMGQKLSVDFRTPEMPASAGASIYDSNGTVQASENILGSRSTAKMLEWSPSAGGSVFFSIGNSAGAGWANDPGIVYVIWVK